MGASVSRAKANIVTGAITEVMVKKAQSGLTSVESTQVNNLGGFNFGTWFSQNNNVTVEALQNVSVDMEVISSIAQKIQNDAKAQSEELSAAYSESDLKLKNVIENYFSDETYQNCVASLKSTQVNNTFGMNFFSGAAQNSDILSECSQLSDVSSKIANEIFQDVNNTADSEAKGPLSSLFRGIFGSIGMIIGGIIGFILLIVIIMVAVSMSGGSGRAPPQQDYYPPPQQDYYPQY